MKPRADRAEPVAACVITEAAAAQRTAQGWAWALRAQAGVPSRTRPQPSRRSRRRFRRSNAAASPRATGASPACVLGPCHTTARALRARRRLSRMGRQPPSALRCRFEPAQLDRGSSSPWRMAAIAAVRLAAERATRVFFSLPWMPKRPALGDIVRPRPVS